MRALRDFLLAPPAGVVLEPSPVAQRGAPATASGRRAASAAAAARRIPRAVGVLCAADDARAVGVAAAALLARRAREPCGLALVWTASPLAPRTDAGPFAGRATRRLAAALAARDVAAWRSGRAVQVALPAEPDEALAVARRAAAVAADAPVVLVVGGPRPEAFDAVLAQQERLLVLTRPGADQTVAALAVAGLPADGPPGAARAMALGPAARALAATGAVPPAALRRALAPLADDDAT